MRKCQAETNEFITYNCQRRGLAAPATYVYRGRRSWRSQARLVRVFPRTLLLSCPSQAFSGTGPKFPTCLTGIAGLM